jgi:hypothetical protein
MIQQLLQSGSEISLILVLALLVVLVTAFKLMEMIFETILITVISGAFYTSLRYIQGGTVSLNDMLLFSFLGASLYMVYSLLETLYSVGSTVLPIPFKLLGLVISPFKEAWKKYEEHLERNSYVDRSQDEEDDGTSTKEVVLGNKEDYK